MNSRAQVLFLYGPTGVGKSDYALRIAESIPSEIINMDMGQLYGPLSIGTAKPDIYATSVPHHCFGILNKPEHYTVTAYRTLCEAIINEVWRCGKLPIVVGGSGFYLKSLFFPPRSPILCNEDNEGAVNSAISWLDPNQIHDWDTLNALDPSRAAQIDPHDRYRIQRALSIWRDTGNKPSTFVPQFDPIDIAAAHIICLTRPRAELYDRINQRVDTMMSQGWLDEVRDLQHEGWEEFIRYKKIIGYNELCDVLHAKNQDVAQKISNATLLIKQRTRNYAKRQLSFWRSLCVAFEKESPFSHSTDVALRLISLTASGTASGNAFYNDPHIDHLIRSLSNYIDSTITKRGRQ